MRLATNGKRAEGRKTVNKETYKEDQEEELILKTSHFAVLCCGGVHTRQDYGCDGAACVQRPATSRSSQSWRRQTQRR